MAPKDSDSCGLNKIAGCENSSRLADLIFIHGLDGDAITTWQPSNEPNKFWPAWLGEDCPQLGIWSLGYAVSSSAWKGHSMPLSDRAVQTLDQFSLKGLGTRPLGFVCHSLGGLLVKQILRSAHDSKDETWKTVAAQTRLIVFLSTPHAGSDLASWIEHLSFVLRSTVSVDDLHAHNPFLRDLNHWYRDHAPAMGIKTWVYCEKRKTHGVLVVNETSADPGIPGVRPIPLDEDHISICKPSSRGHQVYERIKQLVESEFPIPPQNGTLCTNPYDPWTPASPPRFAGRGRILERLQRAMEGGNSVSLVGDTRIGKSSFLAVWAERARACGREVRLLSGEEREGETPERFVLRVTGRETSSGVENAADVLDFWARGVGRPGLRPVIIVDEAERLIREFPIRFFERLRGMLDRVQFIFASRRQLDTLFRDRGVTSPLDNRLDMEWLGLLEPEAAEAVIEWGGSRFGTSGADLMRLWAGRHPFFLQLLGRCLVDETPSGMEGNQSALDRFQSQAIPNLKSIWGNLTEAEQSALRAACLGTPTTRRTLRERGLVTEDGRPFGKVLESWIFE